MNLNSNDIKISYDQYQYLPEAPKEMQFFIYLLECYAYDRERLTGDVLRECDEHGITQEIYDSYFLYHQEHMPNAFADIDSLVATGRHSW